MSSGTYHGHSCPTTAVEEACHLELELAVRESSGNIDPENLHCLAESNKRAQVLQPTIEEFLASGQQPSPRLITALMSSNHAISSDQIAKLIVASLCAYTDSSMPSSLQQWATRSLEELVVSTGSRQATNTSPENEPFMHSIVSMDDFLGRHTVTLDNKNTGASEMLDENIIAAKESLTWLRHRAISTQSEPDIQGHVSLCLALWNAKNWVTTDDEQLYLLLTQLCARFQMPLPKPNWTHEPTSAGSCGFIAEWVGDFKMLYNDVKSWIQEMILVPYRSIEDLLPFPRTREPTPATLLYAALPHLHAAVNQILHTNLLKTANPAVLRLLVYLNSNAFRSVTVDCPLIGPRSDLLLFLGVPDPLGYIVEKLAGNAVPVAPSTIFEEIDEARSAGPDSALQTWLMTVKFPLWQIHAMFSICQVVEDCPSAVGFLAFVWAPTETLEAVGKLRASIASVRYECTIRNALSALENLGKQFEFVIDYGGMGLLVCTTIVAASQQRDDDFSFLQLWGKYMSVLWDHGNFSDKAWLLTEAVDALENCTEWLASWCCNDVESTRKGAIESTLAAACHSIASEIRQMKATHPDEAPFLVALSLRAESLYPDGPCKI